MILSLKRVIKGGWKNFKRQANLSVATCFVLIATTTLVGFLFLSRSMVNFLVQEAREKADISVYFRKDSSEEKLFEVKEEIANIEGVEEVTVKSKEEALEEFVARHGEDENLMDSLAELGSNPFLASLSIKAQKVEDYEKVAGYLSNEKFSGLVEKVDYHKRKPVIQKIHDLADFLDRSGIFVIGVFVFVSFLTTFSTIRFSIATQDKEISIMRLVGASNSFIRGPFLIQGLISGFIAFLVSSTLLLVASYFLTPRVSAFFPGFRVFYFVRSNIVLILLAQFVTSFGLAIAPSLVAVQKYLET